MSTIQIKSSIVLDVLCFLQKRLLNDTNWMNEKQVKEIKHINSFLPTDFENDYIGMSNICFVISAFCDDDLEQLSLDDLINIFMSPGKIESVVKNRIKDDFTASYIYPVLDWLNEGFSEKYIKQLALLKTICFEEIYNKRIMPIVQKEINQKQNEVVKYNCDDLYNNISILKNSPSIKQADVYISFFSYPTAFTLYGGSFLTCFCPVGAIDFFAIVAHELMHGFASKELTQLYRAHVESTDRLSSCHKALIEYYHSGDEEEFVMAAEYYLCYLSGDYTKEQLSQKARKQYGGNCPTSVSIFELLTQEKEIPMDYNKWLIKQFKNGKIG